jgi:hypothetical protein
MSQDDQSKRELSTSDIAGTTSGEDPSQHEATPVTEPPERVGGRVEEQEQRGVSPTSEAPEQDRQDSGEESLAPLMEPDDAETLQRRWEELQTGFVDQPKRSVEEADGLVADVLRRVAEGFSSERQTLEGQWARGEDTSTENLRLILRRYRSFFNRLLSA